MVKRKIINKVHYILFVINYSIFPFISFGQNLNSEINFKPQTEKNNLLYKNSHWEFILIPNITQRAIFTHNPESLYRLDSKPQISGELGVNKIMHINQYYSIIAGLHYGITGRNAQYIVPDKEVGINDNDIYPFVGALAREYDVSYFSFPVQLERRYFLKEKKAMFLMAGFNLRLAPLNGSSSADMNVMKTTIAGNKKPFINFNLGYGYACLLKNLDIFKLSLCVNIDSSYLAKGNFTLVTQSSYDYGGYTVKGSYIGICTSYIFTTAKKYILK